MPGAPQDTALFGKALTSGTATVTLDQNLSLAGLGFNTNSGASYVIGSSGGSTLTFSNTAGAATISNSGGNHTVAAPILLASNLSITASHGSILNLVGGIGDLGGNDSLSLNGGGTLILSGSNGYGGGTTALSGTLELTDAAALPSTGVLTIGDGTQVVLTSNPVITQSVGYSLMRAGTIAPVPEPSTLLLLAAAAVGLAAGAWRRRKIGS